MSTSTSVCEPDLAVPDPESDNGVPVDVDANGVVPPEAFDFSIRRKSFEMYSFANFLIFTVFSSGRLSSLPDWYDCDFFLFVRDELGKLQKKYLILALFDKAVRRHIPLSHAA